MEAEIGRQQRGTLWRKGEGEGESMEDGAEPDPHMPAHTGLQCDSLTLCNTVIVT